MTTELATLGTVRTLGQWTDDDRAQVIAMRLRTGANATMIAHQTGIPRRTCYRWLQDAAAQDNADPMIRTGWQEIVLRAQEKMSRYLDILDDAPDTIILKEAQTLNIFAGTGSDKLRNNAQSGQQNNFYQLVQQQVVNLRGTPPAIEQGSVEP